MKQFLYGTVFRRVLMRFVEIFLISGAVALLEHPDFNQALSTLIPWLPIPFFAMTLKLLRERKAFLNGE